ncbi:MAG: DUF4411 family protein [Terracidiphilus sp.]|jgi:hypothetical protein
MIYCVDTSSLIAAWQERYPIENFPKFWDRIDGLIKEKRLISPVDVFLETKKRSDELHGWLKGRKADVFRELDDAVQTAAASVLDRFPRLVGDKKLSTSADPFVIALALVQGVTVVTEEKLTGSDRRPHIPDVCAAFGVECKSLLDMIRSEKWVVG